MRFNTDPALSDAFYQEVEVPDFHDLKSATFARVTVTNYQGFPIRATREFAFIKNRFLVVRDIAEFEEGFLAQIGPVWNTQNVGPQVGAHWANTFFGAPRAMGVGLKTPPQDLLVYFVPRPGCRMEVADRTAIDPRAVDVPAQLRYLWRGMTTPGQRLLFTQVYYPHAPSMKTAVSSAPGVTRTADLVGTAGADGVQVLADREETTILRFTFDRDREEWVICNPGGGKVAAEGISTDARFLYVDMARGEVKAVAAVGATFLVLAGKEVIRQPERGNYEK